MAKDYKEQFIEINKHKKRFSTLLENRVNSNWNASLSAW